MLPSHGRLSGLYCLSLANPSDGNKGCVTETLTLISYFNRKVQNVEPVGSWQPCLPFHPHPAGAWLQSAAAR